MPASIDDYFRDLLDQITASSVVRASDLNFDKRSSMVGLIRRQIYFANQSTLHLRELIDLRKTPVRGGGLRPDRRNRIWGIMIACPA